MPEKVILNHLGEPIEVASSAASAKYREIVANSLHDAMTNTPYTNPDKITQRQGYDIYQKMVEGNVEVRAGLRELVHGVIDAPLQVEPADESKEAQLHAQFIEDNLESLGSGDDPVSINFIENTLHDMVKLPIQDGVGLFEKIYMQRDWNGQKGRIWINKLKSKPPCDFDFVTDEFGNLKTIVANNMTTNQQDADPGKFLLIPWLPTHSNWWGSSEFRVLYDYWWLYQVLMKMTARYVEKVAGGHWVGKVDDGNEVGVSELYTHLQRASSTGILVTYRSYDAEIKDAASKSGDFFINLLDAIVKQMRRGILGLSTTAESGKTGDAAGQESRDKSVKQPYVRFIRKVISRSLTHQFARPLIIMNWGPQPYYPTIDFQQIETKDADNASRVLTRLRNCGVDIPLAEVEKQTGWRLTVEEDEPVVKGTIQLDKELPDGIGEGFAESEAPLVSVADDKDLRLDEEQAWKDLDAQRKEIRSRIASVVQRIGDNYLAILRKNYETWSKNRSSLTDLQPKFLGLIDDGFTELVKEASRYATQVSNKQFRAAAKAAKVQFAEPDLPSDFEDFTAKYFAQRFGENMGKVAKDTFVAGFTAGLSTEEIAKRFQDAFSKFGYGDEEIVIDEERKYRWHDLERMMHNIQAEIFSKRRREMGEKSRQVAGYRVSSILDSRTTEGCNANHGKRYKKGDPTAAKYLPPNHERCRATYDFVFEFEKPDRWDDPPQVPGYPAAGFGG